ncbi:MAG: right-handed parallel beta-helix repeat-containing protein [Bacteroidetes bacterium]|nr:right-handed parallel beta-helix repeat-containing protein [Bacteroidota bacterium]
MKTQSKINSKKDVITLILLIWGLTGLLFAGFTPRVEAATIYVGPGETYTTIQAGIDAAVAGDIVVVRDGTYTGTGNKDLDFYGKAITLRSEHGAATTIIDCENSGRGFYFHSGETISSVVDGFTITNGNAYEGSGIYNDNASPTITNCVFSGNSATGLGGGGILNLGSSSPTITNCLFSENNASRGGGIFNLDSSSPIISNCTFTGNIADSGGGGILNSLSSSPTVTNCTFSGNSAYDGGGIYISRDSSSTITNCVFNENNASYYGGGIVNHSSSSIIANCVFSGNNAAVCGGGITIGFSSVIINSTFYGNSAAFCGGGIHNYSDLLTITNSIIWGNDASVYGDQIYNPGQQQQITISHSDIQGGIGGLTGVNDGGGNIDLDPLFVDPANGNYHLAADSLCIDAGTNTGAPADDIDNEPRPGGSNVDIGADEHYSTLFVDEQNGDDFNPGVSWPAAKATIQSAIDHLASAHGSGEIHVAAGTYVENITLVPGIELFGGYPQGGGSRDLTINITTIDGNGNGPVVSIPGGDGIRIDGFVIQGGNATNGGGIYISGDGNSPIIENCTIQNNTATDSGGGIYLSQATPIIMNCGLFNNTAVTGAGIYAGDNATIINCTIVDNSVGVGAYAETGTQAIITNSIIRDNAGGQIDGTLTVTYSNIQGAEEEDGNFVRNPRFADAASGNYHLSGDSPCIHAGTNVGAPAGDVDGEARPFDTRVDVGFDEFSGGYIDSDTDGLPDYWEYYYFGDDDLSQVASCGPEIDYAVCDPDLDGMDNLTEYQKGTHPNAQFDRPVLGFVFVDDAKGDDANHGHNWLYPKKTIQAGIDAASVGDTVLVRSGTATAPMIYKGDGNKNLDFGGKAITVRSEKGPEKTIVDCENDGRGFYFFRGETADSVVNGFTIQNGNADVGGGIALTQYSSPTIVACMIKNNQASYGGGIHVYRHSSPRIVNTLIINNTASNGGGGISTQDYATPHIINSTIADNQAGSDGGGIFCQLSYPSWPIISNSILWNNTPNEVSYNAPNSTITFSFSDIKGSGGSGSNWSLGAGYIDNGGNIDVEPRFRDSGNEDFRLKTDSPCIDVGSSINALYSDLRGSLRPININDGPGDDLVHNNFDMGAYEYSAYPNGIDDEVRKAFKDIGTTFQDLITNVSYNITWTNRAPFPNDDRRITGDFEYTVKRLLVGAGGEHIVLDTKTVPQSPPPGGYEYSFKFENKHVGTWNIKIEMVDDPNQFEVSQDPVIIEIGEENKWVIGEPVDPPGGADKTYGTGPELEEKDQNSFFWHDATNTLYAVAPTDGVAYIKWFTTGGEPIFASGTNLWPDDPALDMPEDPQFYIIDSFPANLLPSDSNYSSVELLYDDNGASIDANQFTASGTGYSVLNYWKADDPTFVVVKAIRWDDPTYLEENTTDAIVGQELISSDHDSTCDSGFVFHEISPYAPRTTIADNPYDGYERATRTGPIYPVNDDDLVVVWYQTEPRTSICWPYKPVRYNAQWPDETSPSYGKIIIARTDGTGDVLLGKNNIQIYNQPDSSLPGHNPNEEHALIIGETVFALRSDLNALIGVSEPYVIVKYQEPAEDDQWKFRVFEVVAEDPPDDTFEYDGDAGELIQAPYPLSTFQVCEQSEGLPGGPWWEDYHGNLYAKKDGTGILRFFYPLQTSFFYDLDGDGTQDDPVGACIPWLDRLPGGTPGDPVDVTYIIGWPDDIPKLHVGETLITPKNGLPSIKDQCSVEIIYDESGSSVKLLEVITERSVELADTFELPAEIKTKEIGSATVIFPELPPHLVDRVSYDYQNKELKFKGIFDDSGVGEPLLLLNIMSAREQNMIEDLTDDSSFQNAVDALFSETRGDHLIGETEIAGNGIFKILTAAAPNGGSGYVTLVFNNNQEFCAGNPVGLEVIEVDCADLYQGELKALEPENVFDERMTFKHSGDFAGEPDNLIFEWKYDAISTDEPEQNPDQNPGLWQDLVAEANGQGVNDYTIGGAGIQILQDKWITTHYRGYNRCGPDQWSSWTKPMLYENWVKRLIKKINPFEQRFHDLHNHAAATYVSMIQQAGPRYEGDVALNDDPDYLDSIGLIELYETVLKRAKELSIDGTPPVVDEEVSNNALLMAASRVADLYMLLGNEAYADATDPTIGYTTEGSVGTAAPAIFCFQNQVASLLQEELELLRGRDDSRNPDIDIRPVYNRLIWNFTYGNGQVAYANNYGVETEDQAQELYPQGHGDAWGHYLTAIKRYYDLLRHPNFGWNPQTEQILLAGTPVEVDFLDERNFAAIAAVKARTGTEIVNLTYREKYVEDPEGQWQGYKDANGDRAWGLSEWAARAGQGTYFDWVVGNAFLPPVKEDDPRTGIRKVDRRTVTELAEIASWFIEIQSQVDQADVGLNPLGIAKDAIPFDIAPVEIDQGKTHFEQIYERAVQALNNAISVFNHANQYSQLLRKHQDTLEDFQQNADDREADFTNRLIEVFGYPYSDDIGAGKTYPAGYDGPDLYHYMYVDPSVLMGVQTSDPLKFTVEVTDFLNVDQQGALVKTTQNIDFHVSTEGFGLIKPSYWTGSRRAPGEIQMARTELLLTKSRFEKALIDYDNLIAQIESEAKLLEAQYNLTQDKIDIMYGMQQKQQDLNDAIYKARKRQLDYRTTGRMATLVANAIAEGFPGNFGIIVGLAGGTIGDWTSAFRSAVRLAGTVTNEIMTQMADGESVKELSIQQAKEMVSSQGNIDLTTLESNFAIEQKLAQIAQMIRSEASMRLELFMLQEQIQQAAGRYQSALARGERLLQDRTRYRTKVADDVREYRYKDMAFRIFRNDALQKYRAQFDLAAMYVYLAAKAYDYDTCLLDSSNKAAEHFFTNIVKQRTIGEINSGIPMTGSGLADPMAQLYQNFSVLKTQMGFNNPQIEQNRFSLRKEFFRIQGDLNSNEQWQEALMLHKIENLWDMQEFRRYCRPFAQEGFLEPAIVIPFTTNISSRLNFFGWPLGGQDSYYDSSRFATKIRSVGVWFSNYNSTNLSQTPRIYLVPVGKDVIRSPYGSSFTTRSFTVMDQLIPLPFAINSTNLEDTSWIPGMDTVSDSLNIRRHSRFRAYHDGDIGWEDELVNDSRLIGRSVWNTNWLLIIPGSSLSWNPDDGLDEFIDSVTDIKFTFKTYSYEGIEMLRFRALETKAINDEGFIPE